MGRTVFLNGEFMLEGEATVPIFDRGLLFADSVYEGFGIALIEAMSAGLVPVVEPNAAFSAFARKHAEIALADFGNAEQAADAEKAAGTLDPDKSAFEDNAVFVRSL